MESLKTFFEILEKALTGAAIIVGGFWTYMLFVKKREKYPRALVSHRIFDKNLTGQKKLLHLFIEIENIGNVLLSVGYYNIQICQVLPLKKELENKIKNNKVPYRNDSPEIPWPVLFKEKREFREKSCELEPKEKDKFNLDIIVDKNIKTVQVYSYFKNESKDKHNIGWDNTTFHDLK
jgi:hypothetical protein